MFVYVIDLMLTVEDKGCKELMTSSEVLSHQNLVGGKSSYYAGYEKARDRVGQGHPEGLSNRMCRPFNW